MMTSRQMHEMFLAEVRDEIKTTEKDLEMLRAVEKYHTRKLNNINTVAGMVEHCKIEEVEMQYIDKPSERDYVDAVPPEDTVRKLWDVNPTPAPQPKLRPKDERKGQYARPEPIDSVSSSGLTDPPGRT